MTLGGAAGRGRGRRSGGAAPLAEINIIPLVDVVLVLLIIFMLTASVMEFGMEIDVPKTRTTASTPKELPVVSITKDGDIFLNEKAVNINTLSADIRQRFPGQDAVYLRASKEATWDEMAQVFSTLGDAKFKVNAVTRPEEGAPRR